MRRPLAGFFPGVAAGSVLASPLLAPLGGVLQKLRRRRVSRRPRHGLYQPAWLAREPMGPWP
jgi:hypothetical protein